MKLRGWGFDGRVFRWLALTAALCFCQSTRAETVTTATTPLTLQVTVESYVYTGDGAASWTLPAVSGNQGRSFVLANRSAAGAITLNRAGSDSIWKDGATSTSVTISAGATLTLINDGVYWTALSSGVSAASPTFTGATVGLADGTTAAPSLNFTSDADGSGTGIYRNTANTIGFTANGSATARILASGVVEAVTGCVANATTGYLGINNDTYLYRDAANTLALRNGVNPQTLNVYNTYTSSTNYERGGLTWNRTANYLMLHTEAGAGGGSARAIWINSYSDIYFTAGGGGSGQWLLNSSGHLLTQVDNTYDIGASGARPRKVYTYSGFDCYGGGPNNGFFFNGGLYGGLGSGNGWVYLNPNTFSATNGVYIGPGHVNLTSLGGLYSLSFFNTGTQALMCVGLDANNLPCLKTYNQNLTIGAGSNVVELRNGVNPQTLNIYNTYTSGSVYERLGISALAGQCRISTNTVGGTIRSLEIGTEGASDLQFRTNGTNRWHVASDGTIKCNSDGGYNFGAAANRAASGYFATSIVVGAGTDPKLICNRTAVTDYARLMFQTGGTEMWAFGPRGDNGGSGINNTLSLTGNAGDSYPVVLNVIPGGANYTLEVGAAHKLKASGKFSHGTAGALTIATGAITATKGYHTVDTEAAAATDDLDTVSGGAEGDRLIIRAANAARTVVLKDGTGNLKLAGDCSLDNSEDTIELVHDGTNWLEVCRSNNGA